MGSFWIWLLVSIVFGIICSTLLMWCDKDCPTGDNGSEVKKRFIGSMITFTAVGIIIVLILSLIFSD